MGKIPIFKVTKNTISKKIAKLQKQLGTTNKVMKHIAIDLRNEINKRFEQEKTPGGTKWAKLSKNTLASKAKFNNGTKILNTSGKLKRSIKKTSDDLTARAFTDNIYARTHQYGVKGRVIVPRVRKNPKKTKSSLVFYTARGWVKAKKVKISIPARPFMGFNKKQYKKYVKMINNHLYK